MCLDKEELILLEEPKLQENSTPHQKKMWDLRAKAAIMNEELLKQNLRSLYVIVMSLCNPIMEDKSTLGTQSSSYRLSNSKYIQMAVKKFIQVMVAINLFRMRQERGKSPQNFQEQFTPMRQVCEQIGLIIGQSDQGASADLKKKECQALIQSSWKKQQKGHPKSTMQYYSSTWLIDSAMARN